MAKKYRMIGANPILLQNEGRWIWPDSGVFVANIEDRQERFFVAAGCIEVVPEPVRVTPVKETN